MPSMPIGGVSIDPGLRIAPRPEEQQVAAAATAGAAGGGGEFTGIDAELFGQVVKSMQTGMNNAQPLANYYMGRFNALGVDTSAVSRLLQDYSWAKGQQPMLQRRYTLASALNQAPSNYLGDMTSAGAGNLQYPTSQAAQQAGAKAAQEYKDGKISFKQFTAQLGHDDPDFDTGAVRTLGSDGLRDIESQLFEGSNTATPQLKVIAAAVSAALANGVSFPLNDHSEDSAWNFDMLANLVPYATFPTGTLVSLAKEIGMGGITTTGEEQVKAVLTALARNPKASAEYINQFPQVHDGLPFAEYVSNENPYMSLYAPLYANVITAGTVGAKTVDPKLAAANVTSLVLYYAKGSPSDAPSAIQLSYAKIIAAFWPDLQAAISDPAYVKSPDGISLPASAWQAFLGESMQNPTAAVNLLHLSATEAALLATNNPDNLEAQHASGLINGFFGAEAQKVYQNKMNQLQQAEAGWDKVADLFVGIALDPEGAATTVLSAVVTDAAEQTVNTIMGSSSPTLKAPSVETWQKEWQLAAAETYRKDPTIGDPDRYAHEYHAQPFLTSIGQLVGNATLAQQQAYNAWLKDPAVANASNQTYLNLDQGRLDGETGGS